MSSRSTVEPSSPIYRGPLPHVTTVERVPVTVYEQPGDASRAVAREIADLVTSRAAAGKKTVLGLATGSTPVVIKLPTSALRQEGSSTAVWVLDEATMTVNSQAVELGPVDGNDVVIQAGLKPGQKVVSAGVHVLSPGQKVTIYGAAATATAATATPAER